MENNNEIWKDIPEYEGHYQVSNLGRVKSIKFDKERILNPGLTDRYYIVNLNKNGIGKTFHVHKLMAITFLNHRPSGYNEVVDHINSNKLDNCVENLRIVDQRKNCSKVSERPNKSSKYTGVGWDKNSKKWISNIMINSKTKYLGRFHNEEEAYEAYQKALLNLS